jgi:hypothetical protein
MRFIIIIVIGVDILFWFNLSYLMLYKNMLLNLLSFWQICYFIWSFLSLWWFQLKSYGCLFSFFNLFYMIIFIFRCFSWRINFKYFLLSFQLYYFLFKLTLFYCLLTWFNDKLTIFINYFMILLTLLTKII